MELRAIEVCIEALQRPESTVSERAAMLALDVLTVFKRVARALDRLLLSDSDEMIAGFRSWSGDGAAALQELLMERPVQETSILRWSARAISNIESWVLDAIEELSRRHIANPVDITDSEGLVQLHKELGVQSAAIRAEVDAILIREEAAELVRETRQARDAAQSAAGLTGNASIGTYFSGYARQERRAANTFRNLTILTILAGLGGIAGIGLLGSFEAVTVSAISIRIAVAATATALSTYFARQAGQHRRLYNWARSTQVQLESFPAFIQPVPEAEQGEAYRVLANRVLSAPPERGKESEDSIGSAQLVDLVLTLAKRTQ